MVGLPTVPRYEDKTDQYLFGHRALPTILFETPELLRPLLEPDAVHYLSSIWDQYSEQWEAASAGKGISRADHTVAIRWFAADNALAVVVDLPSPLKVPEPHSCIIVLSPVRAYFPLEMASETEKRAFERNAWFRLSSHGPQSHDERTYAYLGEWTSDNAHRNHGFLVVNWQRVFQAISGILEIDSAWHETTSGDALARMPKAPSQIPSRIPEVKLPLDVVRELDDKVNALLKGATDSHSMRAAAQEIAALIRRAREVHGHRSAEITLHTKHVMRLFIEAGEIQRAIDVAAEWGRFCLEERGTRAPETRIAYTWQARAQLLDPRLSEEERIKRANIRIRMRDRLAGGMRRDLPGSDDPDTTASLVM